MLGELTRGALDEGARTNVRLGVLLVVGALLLWWNLWRALLFFRPTSVRVLADAPPGAEGVPGALEGPHEALLKLGFSPLGTHLEHPLLGDALSLYDYALPGEKTFASLFADRHGEPRLLLLSPAKGGGFVLTADHRRVAREVKGAYLSGGVPGATPERLLKVHTRRLAELGAGDAEWTQDGRVSLALAWYRGAGAVELRLQNAVGLLWTLGALGMVGAAIFGKAH